MYASELVDLMREKAARQSDGWLELEEAAQLLTDAGHSDTSSWCRKLARAAAESNDLLPMHEPGSLVRVVYDDPSPGAPRRQVRTYSEWAHVDDLNAWLAKREPRLPFRFDRPTGATGKPAPVVKALSAHRAQENGVLQALRDAGFNPSALPAAPAGKASPAKQAARKALSYSSDVFDHTWKRLRKDGRIQDEAAPRAD